MSVHRFRRPSETATAALLGLAGSLAFVLFYVGLFRLVPSENWSYVLLVTFGLFPFLAFVQVVRVVFVTRSWLHLVGSLALLAGIYLTVLPGLGPAMPMHDPDAGYLALTPVLPVGMVLLAAGIALDVYTSP